MFAVLKTGGKQYKVTSGDVLRVEKLAADAGEKVQFNDILMVGDKIGAPLVEGAGVQAEVIEQIKGEKVIHYVRRRRKHSSKRTKGHRQQVTVIRISDILAKGQKAAAAKAAPAADAPAKKAPAKKAAAKAKAPAKSKAKAKAKSAVKKAPAKDKSDD